MRDCAYRCGLARIGRRRASPGLARRCDLSATSVPRAHQEDSGAPSPRSCERDLDGDIALRVVPVHIGAVTSSEGLEDAVHGLGVRNRRGFAGCLGSAGGDADRRGLQHVSVPVALGAAHRDELQPLALLDKPDGV